eukprot:c9098_g1_i1.p1 GENE.c9098_g1_i1~~c9098_g1_i1.p1  ORF type:complete len:271 (-),score=48.58 c9098_g1_i1:118-930(-)
MGAKEQEEMSVPRSSVLLVALLLGAATASRTCKYWTHYYVLHDHDCVSDYSSLQEIEDWGCNIPGSPINQLVSIGNEVHWSTPQSAHRIEASTYPKDDSNDACSSPEKFPIPDYCSRAIVSQLSYTFNNILRRSGVQFFMFFNDLFDNRGPTSTTYTLEKIFSLEPRDTRFCWAFPVEYASLYNAVYSKCTTAVSPLQCCKDTYANQMQSDAMVALKEWYTPERKAQWSEMYRNLYVARGNSGAAKPNEQCCSCLEEDLKAMEKDLAKMD